MCLHAEPEAQPFARPHFDSTDKGKWAVAKPSQDTHYIWRHSGGAQARQILSASLERQPTDPNCSQLGLEGARSQKAEKSISAADCLVELVRIEKATAAVDERAVLVVHRTMPRLFWQHIPTASKSQCSR
jgi:hypothetical protein